MPDECDMEVGPCACGAWHGEGAPRPKLTNEQVIRTLAEFMGIELRAKTSQQIGRAVFQGFRASHPETKSANYKFNGTDYYDIPLGNGYGYGGCNGNDGYGFLLWETREGKPWQKDIEAHVEAWREPCLPPYLTSYDALAPVFAKLSETRSDLTGPIIMRQPYWCGKPTALAYALAGACIEAKEADNGQV